MKKNGNVSRYTPPDADAPSRFKGFRKLWNHKGPVIVLHPFRKWRPKHIVIKLRQLGRV